MNLKTPGLLCRCAPRNDKEKERHCDPERSEGEAIQKDDIFNDEQYNTIKAAGVADFDKKVESQFSKSRKAL